VGAALILGQQKVLVFDAEMALIDPECHPLLGQSSLRRDKEAWDTHQALTVDGAGEPDLLKPAPQWFLLSRASLGSGQNLGGALAAVLMNPL
jgi:hypothetical protein